MIFGVNTFLFTSPFTTDSLPILKKIKQWGFDSVELAIEDPSHINVAELKKALADNGLVCASSCGAFGPDRDLRGSKEEQQNSFDYIKGVMDIMAEINCPVFLGPLYSAVGRAGATPKDEYRKQWDTVVGHLEKLGDEARSRNITIAIEPLNRYETDFINTAEQAMKLVKDVNHDSVAIMLDTYHMNIEEKDPGKAIRLVGDKLAHFHACGCDRGTPGNDHINWDVIVTALKDVGYNKSLVIESFTTDVKVIAKAASIWRQFEPSQEDIAIKGLAFLKSRFK